MTETFTWTPDYGAQVTRSPRIREAKFGDGYAQRVGDGLNVDLPKWQLNFTGRTMAEIQAIDEFLRTQAGATSFYCTFADQYLVMAQEWFGTGDGSKVEWQLGRMSNGAFQNIYYYTTIPQIYRLDWQGDQLMYSTPRTNMLLYSTSFGYEFVSVNMIGGTEEIGPSGINDAVLLEAVDSGASFTQEMSGTSGNYCNSVWLKRASGAGYIYFLRPDGVSEEVVLTNSWQRFSVTSLKGVGNVVWGIIIDTSGDQIVIAFGQCESGTVATSYIPTTSVAVTETDYTLGSTGLVTFGKAPVTSADLTWTGECARKFVCKTWNISYPSYGIQHLSAEFEEVIE
jgi:phage-related protein